MHENVASAISEQVQHELGRSVFPDAFPTLPEIPGGRYTREDFYQLEIERLWKKSWLCAGRAEELAAISSYKLFERFGASIIIVRGDDGEIRAFHNTCRHRGAPLVAEGGRAARLVCRYHAWCYNTKGQLIKVPEEHDFGGIDKSSRGLLALRCETWDGWVFVNFDLQANSLREQLGSLPDELRSMQMSQLRIKGRKTYRVKCNWKAAHDAFLEAYHVKAIHSQTVAVLLDPKGTAVSLLPGGHSRMAIAKRTNRGGGTWGTDADAYDIPTVPGVFRENNLAYGVFPNFVVPFDSAGFPFIIFWPKSKDETEIEMIVVGGGDAAECSDNSEYWRTFMHNYDLIMQEDLQFLSGIQRSLDSGAFTGMLLCYQERRIYWVHEEIDRRIGAERVPAELRVTPVLADFAEGQAKD